MSDQLEESIAALNSEVFGKDDAYNTVTALARCAIYYLKQDGKVVAYALVRPGKISTLERYGVRPDLQGTGLGGAILKAVCDKYPVVWTYVGTTNIASAAALTGAGFLVAGGAGEWLNLLYVRSDKYPSKKIRATVPVPQEKLPEQIG